MNAHTITIGENKYPIKYGFNALRLFTQEANLELKDLETLGESIKLDHAIILIWAGLKDGARAEKQPFDLEIADVADLMDDDPTLLTQCMELFVASFIKPAATEKK